MSVLKYFIGGLICLCFLVFCGKQIKSLIDVFRERRNKKSSKEVEEHSAKSPDEEVEKEVNK